MARYRGTAEFKHGAAAPIGILLCNLGTPEAPTTSAVRTYLAEFLADPRIVELPRVLWMPILHGIILNVRPRRSAHAYAQIWTAEGSPLMTNSRAQHAAVSEALEASAPGHYKVALGMRYGQPSIASALRELAGRHGMNGELLEFASPGEIRSMSLRIFDRSFAVTYWLQAVAIGIGLFGVAASFSAQVLARRKEFGLLVHLGLTRAQVLRLLALEGAAWTLLGALAGTALGLAVAAVLVFVVNPQSFHWSMDLSVPWLRLLALGLAVVAAGTATAWVSASPTNASNLILEIRYM
jgi:hypothetical protein